jgi:hypothetical protein
VTAQGPRPPPGCELNGCSPVRVPWLLLLARPGFRPGFRPCFESGFAGPPMTHRLNSEPVMARNRTGPDLAGQLQSHGDLASAVPRDSASRAALMQHHQHRGGRNRSCFQPVWPSLYQEYGSMPTRSTTMCS